jgi:hypothetical protein
MEVAFLLGSRRRGGGLPELVAGLLEPAGIERAARLGLELRGVLRGREAREEREDRERGKDPPPRHGFASPSTGTAGEGLQDVSRPLGISSRVLAG